MCIVSLIQFPPAALCRLWQSTSADSGLCPPSINLDSRFLSLRQHIPGPRGSTASTRLNQYVACTCSHCAMPVIVPAGLCRGCEMYSAEGTCPAARSPQQFPMRHRCKPCIDESAVILHVLCSGFNAIYFISQMSTVQAKTGACEPCRAGCFVLMRNCA